MRSRSLFSGGPRMVSPTIPVLGSQRRHGIEPSITCAASAGTRTRSPSWSARLPLWEEARRSTGWTGPYPVNEYPDDRLALMFACCHPALARDAQVALTLRALGGLTTREIARAFLESEPTVAQRLVRAKRKIREAVIPIAVPQRCRVHFMRNLLSTVPKGAQDAVAAFVELGIGSDARPSDMGLHQWIGLYAGLRDAGILNPLS